MLVLVLCRDISCSFTLHLILLNWRCQICVSVNGCKQVAKTEAYQGFVSRVCLKQFVLSDIKDMAILKWHRSPLRVLSSITVVILELAVSGFSYCSNESVSCSSQVNRTFWKVILRYCVFICNDKKAMSIVFVNVMDALRTYMHTFHGSTARLTVYMTCHK